MFYSHELGFRKPNINAFKEVITRSHAELDSTLFIDDTQRHINAASALGIQTHWLQKNEDICQLFNENPLLIV
ncbi:MAG: HAD family hydrolase [Parashewanella sp.]